MYCRETAVNLLPCNVRNEEMQGLIWAYFISNKKLEKQSILHK